MTAKHIPGLSDIDIVRALVHRDGKQLAAVKLGVAEATVYRWLRTGLGPIYHKDVQRLRLEAKTLTKADIASWRDAESAAGAGAA